MLDTRSPLTSVAPAAPQSRHCSMREITGWSLIQAAGFAATRKAFESAIASVIGKKPPSSVGKSVAAGDVVMFRTGADQIWIVGPAESDLSSRLGSALLAETGAVTDLSHSRVRIALEGSGVRDVLAHSIALDLDPKLFKVGDFALTGIHHTPVMLYRSAADTYEIWPMRTFALSVWEWLA